MQNNGLFPIYFLWSIPGQKVLGQEHANGKSDVC